MNPIKKLIIENFQSHVKTIIEPASAGQLTVIVGPSDSGKTVIFRSKRWVSNNEPDGTGFIRAGANFSRVTEELESGHAVIRHRTAGGINRYIVVSPDGERQTFEGFGRAAVPLEVQEIIGVRPVTIGDTKFNLNLAEQLDSPFLGSSVSAPGRAKVLGKLAGTEEIDHAGKSLNTDLHRRNQDIKHLDDDLDNLERQIKVYEWLPAAKEKISVLEQLVDAVKRDQERREKLIKLKESRQQVAICIANSEAVIYRHRNVELIAQIVVDAEKKNARKKAVEALKTTLGNKDYLILESQCVIVRWQSIDLAFYNVEEAEFKKVRSKDIREKFQKLQVLSSGIRQSEDTLKTWNGLQGAQKAAYKAAENLQLNQRLSNLSKAYDKSITSICSAQETIKCHQALADASVSADRATAVIESRGKIAKLKSLYTQADIWVTNTEKTLLKLAGLNDVEAVLSSSVANLELQRKVIDLSRRLRSLEENTRHSREAVMLHENRVAELEGAYRDELVTLGKCPTCGSIVNLENLREVC